MKYDEVIDGDIIEVVDEAPYVQKVDKSKMVTAPSVPMYVAQEALNFFGHSEQRRMLVEEIGELLVAVSKYERYTTETWHDNIAEEMADVYIMLAQMRVSYGIIDGDLQFHFDDKMKKLKKYIGVQ